MDTQRIHTNKSEALRNFHLARNADLNGKRIFEKAVFILENKKHLPARLIKSA